MSDDADPSGDLVLKVGHGEGRKSIRVSSKVLTLASPVFSAMLSARYAEGQGSAQIDWTVSLPEDDPWAMSMVCGIIHFQQPETGKVSYPLLGKIAELGEKYDLIGPLSGWAGLALQSKKSSIHTKMDCSRLLKVSCVFGSQEAFWVSSLKLIENNWWVRRAQTLAEGAPQEAEFEMNCATLPEDLLSSIKAHREAILYSIRHQLELIIELHVGGRTPGSSATVAHYFRELQRIGLWPISDISSEANLKHVLWKLKQSEDCPFRDCLCYTLDVPWHLGSIAEGEAMRMRGLCLKCVKEGRSLLREGNCMAFFPEDCSTLKAQSSVPNFFLPRNR